MVRVHPQKRRDSTALLHWSHPNLARRQAEHNAGSCIHTAKYRPWIIDVVIEFPEERRAVAFERYLKSGSGVAFAQRHLR